MKMDDNNKDIEYILDEFNFEEVKKVMCYTYKIFKERMRDDLK